MFDLQRFIVDCETACTVGDQRAARETMAAAMNDRSAVAAALGEPKRAGIEILYRSATATILNLVWGPQMTVRPHNHHMWAVIGIYGGREDNIFWRLLPADARWPLEAAGASSLMPGDTCSLGKDIIHSVTNPLHKLTGALHVYAGDFLDQEREEWDDETLISCPYDMPRARRMFEESNLRPIHPG
jgi:predicted metal-dependent enzyme (double-stranded beta helix superfamily)